MGTNAVSVPVRLQLENLRDTISQIQTSLKGVKVDSSAFSKVTKELERASSVLLTLEAQTSKEFSSQNQFNQAEREIEKIEEALQKTKIQLQSINFKDLKLTDEELLPIKELQQKIEEAKKGFIELQSNKVKEFKGTDIEKIFNLSGKSIDTASFQQVFSVIEKSLQKAQNETEKTKKSLDELIAKDSLIKKTKQLKTGVDEGKTLEELFGADVISTFFKKNGSYKNNGSTQFAEYLKQNFLLDDATIEEISKSRASQVLQILKNSSLSNVVPKWEKEYQDNYQLAYKKYEDKKANQTVNQEAYNTVQVTAQDIGEEEAATARQIEDFNSRIKELLLLLEQNRRQMYGSSSAYAELGSQTAVLRQQLASCNAELIKQQQIVNTISGIKSLISNFMGFNQVLNLSKKAFQEATQHIRTLDKVMTEIAVVTDFTQSQLWDQIDTYTEIAQEYGVAIEGVYQVSALYYQMGLDTDEVMARNVETLKMAKIAELDYATAADYMTVAMNAFRMETEEASRVTDVYSAVAATTASNTEELAVAMSKTASSAENVGISFEGATAMIATMVESTRESATNIGSALKSIVSRYGELTKNPASLIDSEGEAMSFNKVDEALQSVSISMKTTEGQFRSMEEVILELADKWDLLSSTEQRYIATQFAGNRQQSRFLALVSNKDLLNRSLKTAQDSEGAGDLQTLKTLDSLETKIQQVQTAYQQFYTMLGMEDIWKTSLTYLTKTIDKLNSMPKLFGKVPLSAINTIASMVATLKNVLLSGFTKITKEYQEKLQSLPTQGATEAAEQSEQAGQNIISRFIKGMRSMGPSVRNEYTNILNDAGLLTGKQEKTRKKNSIVNSASRALKGAELYQGKNGEKTYLQIAYNRLNSIGLTDGLNPAVLSADELRQKLQEIVNEYNEVASQSQQAGQQASQAGMQAAKFWQKFGAALKSIPGGLQKIWKESSTARNVISSLGMALQTISSTIDQTSTGAQDLTNIIQTLSQVAMAMSYSNPIMAIASAAVAIVSGVIQYFKNHSLEAEIEAAEEVANKLNTVALQAKSDYKTLKSSVEEYEELKEERYESAEAAEEYQESVDKLAEAYPELIKGFDASGNAVIDASKQERVLAELRNESARATASAAKAEAEEQRLKLQQAEKELQKKSEEVQDIGTKDPWNNSAFNSLTYFTQDKDKALTEESDILNPENYIENNPTLATFSGRLQEIAAVSPITYFEGFNPDTMEYNNNNIGFYKTASGELIADLDEVNRVTEIFKQELTDETTDSLTAIKNFQEALKEAIPDDELRNSYFTSLLEESAFDEYYAAYAELEQQKSKTKSARQAEASAVLSVKLQEQGMESVIDNSSIFTAFSSAIVKKFLKDDNYKNYSFEDYFAAEYNTETLEDLYGPYEEFYNQLTTSQKEAFEEMFSNGDVSFKNLVETFKISENSDIYKTLETYYADTTEEWTNLIKNRLGNKNEIEISSQSRYDTYNAAINKYEALLEQGFIHYANGYLTNFEAFYNEIEESTLSESEKDSLFNLLSSADLTSYSGFIEITQDIKDFYEEIGKESPSELTNYLDNMKDKLVSNLSLSFSALTESILSKADELNEVIEDAAKSMDFNDAYTLYEKLKSIEGNENLSFDKLFKLDATDPTKYILRGTKDLQSYREEQYKLLQKESEELKTKAQNVSTLISNSISSFNKNQLDSMGLNSDSFSNADEFFEALQSDTFDFDPELFAAISELSLQEAFYDYYNSGNLQELQKVIQEKNTKNTEAAAIADKALAQMETISPIQDAVTLGQYASAREKLVSALNSQKITEKDTAIWKNYINTQAQETYSKLIEDFAKGGVELIRKNADTYGEYSLLAKAGGYEDILNRLKYEYSQDNYSTKEYNEQRAALEEANRTVTQALNDSIISLTENSLSITEDLISDFATAQSKSWGEVIQYFSLNEDGTYSVSLENIREIINSYGEAIPKNVEDTLRSYLSSIVKFFENGFDGKATLEDLNNLSTAFGIGTLDYTETIEGLKLTRQSIYKVLAEVQKQDALTFTSMVESYAEELGKANDEYDDIYSVMRKIEKIEEEIAKKPDSTRLELLEAELAVAKEIEQTLKEADNTFNFMDRDLPSGFDDPMSAWEGVGNAMKVINDDEWAKGRVGLEDFYNMIDFMGDEILESGDYFQGQLISAADLIQKGFDAISMIDGEAYVDLSKLGESFKLGSADMKEGIVAGMKNVAKSQVEMLDAAISILETVVAIQNLDNGDGTLELGEIFNNPLLPDGSFKLKWVEGLQTVNKTLEELGIDASQVIIGSNTLKDLLTKDLDVLKLTKDEYQQIMQIFLNWANGDFDKNAAPEELLTSLARQMQGLEEFTYTLGEQKITVDKRGGVTVEEKDGDGNFKYSYTISGKTVSSNDPDEFSTQKQQAQTEYVAENVIGEEYETKIEEGSTLTINEDPSIECVIETDENGEVIGYWYKQQKYEDYDSVAKAIATDQAQAEKLSNAGVQVTGETITIGEKVYTQYQLSTGDTTYIDENGNEVNKEDLNRLALQEAGFTGATNVPIEANLEITTLDSISFAEGIIPEEGIPFEGSIRITPTSVEIGATNYTVDFLNENGQAVQTIAITGEAQLAAVISGAKIEGDEWVLPDMSADLNLSISEETQEKIRAFFDEIIQKFQNIPVSFNTNGGATSSSGTASSSNSTGGSGGGSIQTKNNMVPMSYMNSINQMISNIQSYVENLKGANNSLAKETQGITNLNNVATALKNVPSSGATKINAVSTAIGRLPSSKTISIQLQVNLSTLGAKMTTVSGGTVNTNGKTANVPLATAKGNIALSKGTLMGELGPELVVSNGHYFTVGENGAEFVDLADDAIVFNHLQTKKLLGSGSTGRGTPVTNERKATALASGNAMADAATTLAELKQIRAMWKALLDADSATLGKKAGSGSGGSGGSNKETGPVEYDLERWYNLLRQISKLEQQITYEQAKRENMRSGYNYVDSLEKELDLLEKQLKAEKELASLQYDYYLKRMEDVNKGVYSKIFTYDSEGLMQYVDGENRGLDALAKLQATDESGVLKMTAKEQLNYITNTLGIDINDLKYKSNGTEAKEDKDKVQVFFDNVDSIMDELDELYDSYHEHAEKIEDLTSSQNEILQEYVDNQRSLEDKLLQAIEDREQAVIDKLTDEKEAIENASQEYINGLNDALSKEQELYNKNETDTETAKLQRRLAILQRSGGSVSEIKSLQDQINSRLKDAYFQAQQDQIEAIQEASNKQLEKLQDQIDLMTETLEYQKENGLLWQEVYEMLNDWTPEKMLQFIEQYTKTYKENSSLENEETSKDTLKEAEIYAAKRDKDARDTAWSNYYNNANYSDTIKKANADKAQEAFNSAYASGGVTAGEIAANKVFSDAAISQEDGGNAATSSPSATETEPDVKVKGKGTVKTKGSNLNVRKGPGTKYSIIGKYKNKASVVLTGYKNGWYQVDYNGKTGYVSGNYISTSDKKNLPAFADGGLVNFTGPAWVDGTKSKPEAFLSAEDTAMLKSKIFSNSDGSLKTLVAALEDITNKTSSYQGEGSGNIVIENATVNIQPGTISNDYDARRAGELALEEMVKIARKTTNRTIRR